MATTPVVRAGAATFTTGGGSATLAVTKPSSTQTGDLILIWCTAGFAGITWSATGFTAVTAVSGTNGSGQLLYRTADGTEGASFTVTASVSHPWDAGIISLGGVAGGLFDPTPTSSGQVNTSSTSITAPGVTTTTDGDLLVWFGGVSAGSGVTLTNITLPAGYTAPSGVVQAKSTGSGTANAGLLFGTSTQATHGATGSVVGTSSSASVSVAMVVPVPGATVVAGTYGLVGAFTDPAVYGLTNSTADQAAAVSNFNSIVARNIGVRRTAYGFRVIPATYDSDKGQPTTGGGAAPAYMVGSTCSPNSMGLQSSPPQSSDWVTAANKFDSILGRNFGQNAEKFDSQSGSTGPNYNGQVADNNAFGNVFFLVSFIPHKLPLGSTLANYQNNSTAVSDRDTMDASIKTMLNAGMNFWVTLDQEPNQATKWAGNASDYQTYVKFYITAIHGNSSGTRVPFCYDPTSGNNNDVTDYPGDQFTDAVVVDYYCSSHTSGHRLAGLAALANGHTANSTTNPTGNNGNGTPAPIPFGLGEFGGSASGTTPTLANWNSYMDYLAAFFKPGAGNVSVAGPLIWFNGGQFGPPGAANWQVNNCIYQSGDANFVNLAGYSRIPKLQVLYDTCNGNTA